MSWLSDNWRDVLNVVGIVVGFWGLGLTYRQAHQARIQASSAATAATQAKDLAQLTVDRITSTLLITELAAAATLADGLHEACRQTEWALALDRAARLKRDLASFKEHPVFVRHEIDKIQEFILNLTQIQQDLTKRANSASQSTKMREPALKVITDASAFLSGVEGRLKVIITEVLDVH